MVVVIKVGAVAEKYLIIYTVAKVEKYKAVRKVSERSTLVLEANGRMYPNSIQLCD